MLMKCVQMFNVQECSASQASPSLPSRSSTASQALNPPKYSKRCSTKCGPSPTRSSKWPPPPRTPVRAIPAPLTSPPDLRSDSCRIDDSYHLCENHSHVLD